MQDNSNGFYTDYSDDYEPFLPDDTEKKMAAAIINDPIEQKKKERLVQVLLTLPLSIGILLIIMLFIIIPPISQIGMALKETAGKVACPLALAIGAFLANGIVHKVSSIGEKGNQDILNKHIPLLIVCSALCLATAASHIHLIFNFILFAISMILIIFSWKIYTAFERKLFLPIMCVMALTSILVQFPYIWDVISPRTELAFSTDYYFVSSASIEPKKQPAQYYVDENLRDTMQKVLFGGGIVESYEQFQNDIIHYDDPYTKHQLSSDDSTAETFKKIALQFGTDYDESFFENHCLLIEILQYPDSPEKVSIDKILLHGESLEITDNIYYPTDTHNTDFTEFCVVFVKIPKSYHLKYDFGISHEQNFLTES